MLLDLLLFFALLPGPPSSAFGGASPMQAGSTGSSFGFWRELPVAQARRLGRSRLSPTYYRVYLLDTAGLKKALARAEAASGPEVLLPLPTGPPQAFRMRASSVLAPALAARYPELRTYAGQRVDAPADYVRLELTPTGLHAQLVCDGHTYCIEPFRAGDTRHYLCFDKAALPAGSKQAFEIPGGPGR